MARKQTPRSHTNKKRTLLTLGALLVVNAVVAHIVIAQITPHTSGTQSVLGTEAIAPEEGQAVSGDANTLLDRGEHKEIEIYTVKSGDTISGIAEKFHISVNTIRWANELDKSTTIKVGQKLVILPITGIQYTVKSGDTVSGIAHKFDTDQGEILDFNDLEDPKELKPGMNIIIPDAEMPAAKPATPEKPATTSSPSKNPTSTSTSTKTTTPTAAEIKTTTESVTKSTGLSMPVPGSILTQALHDVNAVDLGAPTGTPVLAAKEGIVIVSKNNGAYNGGFGNFVVINHGGMQTLYAHLSKVSVKVGDTVDQGDVIGNVGSTGKSTGPHLHLEVHGAKNPWAANKKGTHY
jgi:murein DD-endopeptidase MepM/ murein hydrolase activator NlpD